MRVSVARPMFDAEVNILGSLNVLEAARAAGSRKVVFASSGGTIYGDVDPRDLPIKETPAAGAALAVRRGKEGRRRLPRPRTASSTSSSSPRSPSPTCTAPVRTRTARRASSSIFAGRLLSGQPCTIFGDGDDRRATYVFVDDVVDAFVRAASKGGGLLVNIGSGRETSVNALYATMARAAGVE